MTKNQSLAFPGATTLPVSAAAQRTAERFLASDDMKIATVFGRHKNPFMEGGRTETYVARNHSPKPMRLFFPSKKYSIADEITRLQAKGMRVVIVDFEQGMTSRIPVTGSAAHRLAMDS